MASQIAKQAAPVILISVNTFPERAKLVIGKFINAVSDRYSIVHAGNSTTIEGVAPLLLSTKPTPQLLFCASMWTPEEQAQIQEIGRKTIPGIKTFATPSGLQGKGGPDGVVEYLLTKVDGMGIPQKE
ncbi:hypothetical protein T439DRAFT_304960 [Meredithblackwellia eburnea MCA 4105]